MNFEFNKPYSSLEIAKELAKEKKCILIYAYWTDNDPYQRYPAYDSFVFYKYTTFDDFMHYLIKFMDEVIKCCDYEMEDGFTHDDFEILIDDFYPLRVVNFPKEVEIDDEQIEKFFLDNFPHAGQNYEKHEKDFKRNFPNTVVDQEDNQKSSSEDEKDEGFVELKEMMPGILSQLNQESSCDDEDEA